MGGLSLSGGVALALCCACVAVAQTSPPAAPPPATAPDPAYDAAQKSFDALPEAERRAVQEGLIWTGDFQAVITGVYGKRTQSAILAYAKKNNLPLNGLLDDKARAALEAAAAAAKKALLFAPVADKASGAVVSLPARLLTKASPGKSGTRYAAPDNSASLETFAQPLAEGDLAATFDRMKADAPGRKVVYKLLRPDFFVVSGEDGGQSFYTRFAHAPGATGLRGYTLSYAPAARATFDKVSIAIANAFEPFPGAAATPAVAANAAAPPATGPAAAAPPPPPPALKPVLETSGLVVAPGQVLAALPASGCTDPGVGRGKGRILREDKASGLALIEAAGVAPKPLALSAAGEGNAVVLFFQNAGGQAQLAAAAGELIAGSPPHLRAPLAGGATGGAVFDRTGALIGLLQGANAQKVAGPSLPASYEIVPAAAALACAGAKGGAAGTAPQTAGAIVASEGGALVPVYCTR